MSIEGLKVGDKVRFQGYGAGQLGTVARIGRKNVVLDYVTRAEHLSSKKYGHTPTVKRRSYPHAAFYQNAAGAWCADWARAFAQESCAACGVHRSQHLDNADNLVQTHAFKEVA